MSRSRMPSKKKLADYYLDGPGVELLEEHGVDGCGYLDASAPCCMACGHIGGLQRAHILSAFNGGSHDPDNIHLLCRNCHAESEAYSGEPYWRWLRFKIAEPGNNMFAKAKAILKGMEAAEPGTILKLATKAEYAY